MAVGVATLERAARAALADVGDASAGEWIETTEFPAVHVRRRLSELEEARVGPVVDIRGTAEARMRLEAVKRWTPAGWQE